MMCPRPWSSITGITDRLSRDRRHEVHRHELAELLGGQVHERARQVQPGVVHEHVDRAVAGDARG